ncbi:preprotein translocase subunit YajC [Corynebacterium sp. 13CS0277]|uniref:preprotein translocase subunit YajC n=1 Tax=Corynebacterium sp. 13CS0277 TaxID=2071994 RepID=UPI001304B2F2|nr:preprotein translocase subunit YajC [Corynebacterium sp. 13CS0277]
MNITLLLLLVIVFLTPTLLQMRRQKARLQQLQTLQASLAVGDAVMTTSGVHAVVAGVEESTVALEIAPGVVTTWERTAIVRRVEVPAAAGEMDPAPEL